MRAWASLSLALLALTSLLSSAEPQSPPPFLTQLPRPLSPAERGTVEAVNRFSFALMRQAIRSLPHDSNAFLSPFSASMALGMALNGAKDQTFTGMQSALQLNAMSENDVNQGYRSLQVLLKGLDSLTEIRIANAMWGRQGLSLEPGFTDAARRFFDAEVETLDFGSPAAASTINQWVSGKTNQRIKRLVDRIGSNEMLYLVNAVYFKGKWREAFDPKRTRNGPFHGADGRDRSAPLMQQRNTLRYDETEDYQAVDLLYGNGAFAMTVLLPKGERTPRDLLTRLDPGEWSRISERFHDAEVNLTLPRFRLEYTRRLNDDLKGLGMEVAFDPSRADFSRIADVRSERLYLSRVDQKTFVEVNEEGTEAAAATGVGVAVTSMPRIFEMRVDRPFVFAIRERLSGAVVFLGTMNVVGT